jgi:hypothetical protein
MSLDDLWKAVKDLKYPINDKEALIEALGDVKIDFDNESMDARDIAMEIIEYPIKNAPDLIRDFLKEESAFSKEEAEATNEILEEPKE